MMRELSFVTTSVSQLSKYCLLWVTQLSKLCLLHNCLLSCQILSIRDVGDIRMLGISKELESVRESSEDDNENSQIFVISENSEERSEDIDHRRDQTCSLSNLLPSWSFRFVFFSRDSDLTIRNVCLSVSYQYIKSSLWQSMAVHVNLW